MKEDLLHYLWESQQFSKKSLKTLSGDPLRIMKVGTPHREAGPDFQNASLRIKGILWRGDIEIHLKSSDWYAHKHSTDERYQSVILHVVWENNKQVFHLDGTEIPTLILKGRVKETLLLRYETLMKERIAIPCKARFLKMGDTFCHKILEKMLEKRFMRKYAFVNSLLRANSHDTEATAYQLLGYNFGFKANSDACLDLVKRIPFRLITQHRSNLLYLEALLLGQAGLLERREKNKVREKGYVKELLTSYAYLKKKHRLGNEMPQGRWNFCRLRPVNFPTIRLTQLAMILHQQKDLFGLLINSTAAQLHTSLTVQQSPYWRTHYLFGKKSKQEVGGVGKLSVENILINTVVPLLVTYGKIRSNDFFIEKGKEILRRLPAENNSIVRKWSALGLHPTNAFESQASIELFKEFCQQKKCLSCEAGKLLLASQDSF